jgi:hypothetical protein
MNDRLRDDFGPANAFQTQAGSQTFEGESCPSMRLSRTSTAIVALSREMTGHMVIENRVLAFDLGLFEPMFTADQFCTEPQESLTRSRDDQIALYRFEQGLQRRSLSQPHIPRCRPRA